MADYGDFDPRSVAAPGKDVKEMPPPSARLPKAPEAVRKTEPSTGWATLTKYRPIFQLLGIDPNRAEWTAPATRLSEKNLDLINKFAKVINDNTVKYDEKSRRIISRFVLDWISSTGNEKAIYRIVKEGLSSETANDADAFAALIIRRQDSFLTKREIEQTKAKAQTRPGILRKPMARPAAAADRSKTESPEAPMVMDIPTGTEKALPGLERGVEEAALPAMPTVQTPAQKSQAQFWITLSETSSDWALNPRYGAILELLGIEPRYAKRDARPTVLDPTVLQFVNSFAEHINSSSKYNFKQRAILALFVRFWMTGTRSQEAVQLIVKNGLSKSKENSAPAFAALVIKSQKSFLDPADIAGIEKIAKLQEARTKRTARTTAARPVSEVATGDQTRPSVLPSANASRLEAPVEIDIEEEEEEEEESPQAERVLTVTTPAIPEPIQELEFKDEDMDKALAFPTEREIEYSSPLLPNKFATPSAGLKMSPAIDVSDRGAGSRAGVPVESARQLFDLGLESESKSSAVSGGGAGSGGASAMEEEADVAEILKPMLVQVVLEDAQLARTTSRIQVLDGIPAVITGFADMEATWAALQNLPIFLNIPEHLLVWNQQSEQYVLLVRRIHTARSTRRTDWERSFAQFVAKDKARIHTEVSYDIFGRVMKSGTANINQFAGEYRLPKSYSR